MTETENAEIADLKSDITDHENDSIQPIPFSLLEKRNNRTTKLVSTSGDVRPIDGRRRWHDFDFKEPFLVTRILVQVDGYGEFGEFRFSWTSEDGSDHETEQRPEDSVVNVAINDICRGIRFRPPQLFFSSARILSVAIEGIRLTEVPAALESLADLEGH